MKQTAELGGEVAGGGGRDPGRRSVAECNERDSRPLVGPYKEKAREEAGEGGRGRFE